MAATQLKLPINIEHELFCACGKGLGLARPSGSGGQRKTCDECIQATRLACAKIWRRRNPERRRAYEQARNQIPEIRLRRNAQKLASYHNTENKARRESLKAIEKATIPERLCIDCGNPSGKRRKDAFYCTSCLMIRLSARKKKRRNQNTLKRINEMPTGRCTMCGKRFKYSSLNTVSRKKFCSPSCNQRYYYRIKPEKVIQYRKAKNAYARKWIKQRYETDPSFRLKEAISSGMYRSLKGNKAGQSWEKLVDYTSADLRYHLERQFKRGMTWSNYGTKWHVDHIVPVAAFAFTSPDDPDFKACWALTNLRPLWSIENVRKRDNRTHLL